MVENKFHPAKNLVFHKRTVDGVHVKLDLFVLLHLVLVKHIQPVFLFPRPDFSENVERRIVLFRGFT